MSGVEAGGVAGLLEAARRRIERLEPEAAWAAASAGEALIVDIRSEDDRSRDGIVPGSLHVPRTVLEWRVDAGSEWHNPHTSMPGRRLLLLCSEGFSSSLAAASLLDVGIARVGDVSGGFVAWRRLGLPVRVAPDRPQGMLAGMGPPD